MSAASAMIVACQLTEAYSCRLENPRARSSASSRRRSLTEVTNRWTSAAMATSESARGHRHRDDADAFEVADLGRRLLVVHDEERPLGGRRCLELGQCGVDRRRRTGGADGDEVVPAAVQLVVGWHLVEVTERDERIAAQDGAHAEPGAREGTLAHLREDAASRHLHRTSAISRIDVDGVADLQAESVERLASEHHFVGRRGPATLDDPDRHVTAQHLEVERRHGRGR